MPPILTRTGDNGAFRMHGAFLAAVSSTAFAVAAPAGAATLNLLIWEAYIDERILKVLSRKDSTQAALIDAVKADLQI